MTKTGNPKKKENQKLFDDNSKISDQFNKAVIKLMSVGFTQDTNMTRIRNALYIYLSMTFDTMKDEEKTMWYQIMQKIDKEFYEQD
jgi:hypothetical protein